jgi:hypothetical protein
MSRKHNCPKSGRSNYKKRLADRGLSRTPVMTYTGMTTLQLQAAFARAPHYKWISVSDENGSRFNRRVQVD